MSDELLPEETYDLRKYLKSNANAGIVISIGRFSKQMGAFEVIEVAGKLSDMEFFWFDPLPFRLLGRGEHAAHTALQAASSNFHYMGYADRVRRLKLYQDADVFYLPAREQWNGTVLFEAMACHVPVVTRKIPDIIQSYLGNSLYYTANIPEDIACIRELMRESRAVKMKDPGKGCNKLSESQEQ
ncbi:MAG: glycosyltransferase [Clostridiales bacterium]|nr:glycosyltransferase [Clostridiales bacterium]